MINGVKARARCRRNGEKHRSGLTLIKTLIYADGVLQRKYQRESASNNSQMQKLNNHAAILLIVLIMVLTISLLGATLMTLFFNVLSLSQTELDRTRALYLAEAGIAKAVSVLKSQAGILIIPPTKLGEGYFEVYNDIAQSTIISLGTSNGVKRTIQLRYNAF